MTEFKIYGNLDKVLNIVYTLRADGLRQGVNFDFTWVPERSNYLFGKEVIPRHAIFKFYDTEEEYSMIFALKYGA